MAASNVRYEGVKFSSSCSIDATFPHLCKVNISHIALFGGSTGKEFNIPIAVIWRTPDRHDCVIEHELMTFHHLWNQGAHQKAFTGSPYGKIDVPTDEPALSDPGCCCARIASQHLPRTSIRLLSEKDPSLLYLYSAAYQHIDTPGSKSRGDEPSGSDHNKSHIAPSCGTSCFRSISRICTGHYQLYNSREELLSTHLIQSMHRWTQSSMNAKHSSIHYRSQTEIIKHLATIPPHTSTAILPQTLVIESIDLGDLSRLMITPDECYSIRITHFEGEEKEESLDTVESSVYVVSCMYSTIFSSR